MKKCDTKPYGRNKNHYFNKQLSYKNEKSITKTHHETRELRTGNVVQDSDYCQIGAVKPDPHKQQAVFVNKLLTILNNSEILL